MKSHPDAASRLAAEVVTQLPVPSRLGLLRFERLNEASWALLYLDSGCEQQFGLPAHELCSLLDAPYASLMEPAAPHQVEENFGPATGRPPPLQRAVLPAHTARQPDADGSGRSLQATRPTPTTRLPAGDERAERSVATNPRAVPAQPGRAAGAAATYTSPATVDRHPRAPSLRRQQPLA